jgi:hypothetical protein
MRDGIGQVGAGADDRRLAGSDLQHNVQSRTADEAPHGVRMVTQNAGAGGPMKEAIDEEMRRHADSREMRLAHLKNHYER